MLIIAWVIGLVLGIGLGGIIATRNKSKCNHKWKLIDSGNVVNGGGKVYGIYKFYECEYCQKMKKEQLEVN